MTATTGSPYASLQHAEALARADLLTVTSYDVRLDLSADESTFVSVTTIDLVSRGGETFLDVKPVRLDSLSLDGVPLDVGRLERGRYPLRLDAGEHRLVVDAVMPFRHDGEGLHRSTDPADGRDYVYGMSFMDAAPTVFACFDQPDLKAPYTLHVRAPGDWTVIGNAPLDVQEDGPGGTRQWHFRQSAPLSTYVVTLVAGPWHVVRDEHDGIPLGLSCRASIARHLDADADELLTLTRQCFDEFHRLFGIRYPFGDYHQAFVPEFNAGAMENPGCVTFRDPLVFTSRVTRGARLQRATTVAHEMAHQWFGNLVTPRWWDDLWLNESFAEYLGNRVTADVTAFSDAWVDNAYARRQWGLVADQSPSTHPVAGNGAVDASAALQDFDGISYAKGSAVLRQLDTLLGDEAFFGGAVDLMQRHRFGNASMADLFAAWERAAGRDLSGFTEQWLRTSGPDTIALDRAAGVVRRTPPADHPADRTHVLHVARGASSGGLGELERLEVTGPETPYDAGDDALVVDPVLDTWAATLVDETTMAALPRLLPDVADPLVRAGTWSAVRSTLHHAAASPAAVLDVVLAALPVEDTLGSTTGWVRKTLLPLCGAEAPAQVHDAALRRLGSLEPSSELRLSAFRVAVGSADHAHLLRAWLGGDVPAGIELDEDLRWRILVRVASIGGTDRDELDRALAADPTNVARIEHTRAVAAMPTAEAKAFAWQRFTGEVEVPNYELSAAGLGMWQGGQDEVTAPYVERYFDEVAGTVAVRSGWLLAEAADAFFPSTVLEQPVLDRTRALAADGSVDASIRRRLVDRADHLSHQLAVLARWPR